MKKALLTLFIFSSFLSISQAQKATLGVKAGLNYANISGGDISETDPAFKYHVGAILSIGFTDFFSLQPEFIFSAKGFESDNFDVNMDYLDMPILLKLKFGDKFSLHAGPQLSYLLSSSTDTDINVVEFEDRIKDFDLGAAAGIELELISGFSLGARYSFSVESIGDDYDVESVDPNNPAQTIIDNVEAPDYKNGLVQVFAAFVF